MSRHRWARAIWPFDMRSLAQRLDGMPYDGSSPSGFILDVVRSDYLVARFVERMELTNIVTDPRGQETSYDRVEFNLTSFVARSGSYGLELIDPGRSSSRFISAISEACEDRFSVSTISINPLHWAESLSNVLDAPGRISSVQCAKIDLGSGTQAKAVISGNDNVLAGAEKLIDDRSHIIEKVKIDFRGKVVGSVVLGNMATASISGEGASRISEYVRLSLEKTQSL